MDFNSLNPYLGTERENIWKNSPHREKKNYTLGRGGYGNYEHDNDNSESVGSTNNNPSKLIVKIRFDKEDIKTGNKRSHHSKSSNIEYDEFGDHKVNKRAKY